MNMNLVKVLSTTVFVTGGCIAIRNQHTLLKADEDFKVQYNVTKSSLDSEKKRRVAVIGGGIGAASTVYFLRKIHGPSVDIDVFEKTDQCGGRLKMVKINGQETEAGGTYLLSTNKYMMEFCHETDSEMNVLFTDLKMGVWNGEKFVCTLGKMDGWLNKIGMAWQFGIFSLMNLDKASKFVGNSFDKIYDLQDDGKFFDSVPEMLHTLDDSGKLFGYTQKSCDQAMKEEGVGKSVVNDLINPIIRWNLGQNSDNVSGLTGFLVAAGGGEGYIWNFKGGNSHICRKLFEISNASVHYNAGISKIERSLKDNKCVYRLTGHTKDEYSSDYDVVVISAPLDIPSAYIECESCPNWPQTSDLGCYQKRVVNFIEGEVKPKAFGMADNPENLPGLILTTKIDANDFDTIITQYDVDGNQTSPKVHLVFTQDPITLNCAKKLFNFDKAMTSITSVNWLACPRYKPQERFIPLALDSGIFYLNSMERIKGGMEIAAISGRNAALLTHNHLVKN